jgi:hypothetical protein
MESCRGEAFARAMESCRGEAFVVGVTTTPFFGHGCHTDDIQFREAVR